MTPRTSSLQHRGAAPSGARCLTRRERGAAYVEAILVVIFMIIIFVGVQYLGSYFHAKQRALGKARECAWAFSKNACVPDTNECGTAKNPPCLPAGCAEVVGGEGRVENEPNEELKTNIQGAQKSQQGLDPDEQIPPDPEERDTAQKVRGGVDDEMGPMMEMLVGEGLNAVASAKIKVPRMIPNAQDEIEVVYYLPCNLRHRDPLSLALELFGSVFTGGL